MKKQFKQQSLRFFSVLLDGKLLKVRQEMATIKSRIARIVHKTPRDIVRRVFAGLAFDKPSMLAIGSFGGFEIAYRKNTADESVIADSFENDIFFSGVPEYQPEEGHVIIDIGAHIGTFSL